MKIAVTGGAGFIGSTVVDRLINEGHEVIVIDNLSSGKRSQVNERVTFYEADITDQGTGEIFAKERPEVLNHHAAQIDVRKSVANPALDARVNIVGLLHLMEIGRKIGLKKVIFASSGGAILPDAREVPTKETYPPRPVSPYGISKLSGEYYLDFYARSYNMQTISLRYGNVYGPRQDPHGEAGVVAIFVGKLLSKEIPVIYGDGQQQRDYVFVEDVVDANLAALDCNVSGVFNIGTGSGTSVNTLLNKIQQTLKTHVAALHAPPRLGEAHVSVLDCNFAKEKLGWQAKTTLEEGIAKTAAYFAPKFES